MVTSSTCQISTAYKTTARIDILCEVLVMPFKELSQMEPSEPSSVIRKRVIKVR